MQFNHPVLHTAFFKYKKAWLASSAYLDSLFCLLFIIHVSVSFYTNAFHKQEPKISFKELPQSLFYFEPELYLSSMVRGTLGLLFCQEALRTFNTPVHKVFVKNINF